MRDSFKIGIGFGLTSGIITTLGLIVGLESATASKVVIMGGILSIAIADALSDAMGIHVSQECKRKCPTKKEIWEATIITFLAKFLFALSFAIPILLFEIKTAITLSILWGLCATTVFTYTMNKNKKNLYKILLSHLSLTIFVIIATYLIGKWIATVF